LKDYEREIRKEGKNETYICQHTNWMKEFFSFVEYVGITSLKNITQSTADEYMLYMEQERKNENFGGTLWQTTINLHITAISKFWQYLSVEGIPANNIFLRHRKKIKQKEIIVLTREEIKHLYAACDADGSGYRDRAMLAVYYGCGLRHGEGLRLQVTDFDFDNKRIHIRKSKNGSERYVVMSPTTQQHLEDYICHYRDAHAEQIAVHPNPDAFFIGEYGSVLTKKALLSRLKKLWKRVQQKQGSEKQIGIHLLRHTLGTHLYMAKLDIEKIALMLGHRSLCTTQVYIHLSNALEHETNIFPKHKE
jgi:site-specific recombinase XerD